MRVVDRRRISHVTLRRLSSRFIQPHAQVQRRVIRLPNSIQHFNQRALGDHHSTPGLGHLMAQALLRQSRIQRQVGATGLEDAQQRHDHVEGALDAHADRIIRHHVQGAQVVAEEVGARVEFAVGQLLPTIAHRHGLRPALRLLLEPLVDAPVPGRRGIDCDVHGGAN